MLFGGEWKGAFRMKRIIVLGVTGSGKTTFGRKLAARLGCKAVDLDDLNWLPGWVQRPTEEMYALAEQEAKAERWVVMGNYSKIRPALWPHADTFIWLDYSFLRTFWQLLRRSILRAIDKNTICKQEHHLQRECGKLAPVFFEKQHHGLVFQELRQAPARIWRHLCGSWKNA
jgi:adenylate kinase family enzyme